MYGMKASEKNGRTKVRSNSLREKENQTARSCPAGRWPSSLGEATGLYG